MIFILINNLKYWYNYFGDNNNQNKGNDYLINDGVIKHKNFLKEKCKIHKKKLEKNLSFMNINNIFN